MELFVLVCAIWEGRWSPQTVRVKLKKSKEGEDEGVKQQGRFRRKLNWVKTGRCEWIIRLGLLRPGVLGGREDEVQPLQGVHSLMTELLPLEQLDESAVKLVQLRLLDLPGNDTQSTLSGHYNVLWDALLCHCDAWSTLHNINELHFWHLSNTFGLLPEKHIKTEMSETFPVTV